MIVCSWSTRGPALTSLHPATKRRPRSAGGGKKSDDQGAMHGPTCRWVADMAPRTLVGKTLHAMDGVGASCPANTGMVAWKFAKESRVWYEQAKNGAGDSSLYQVSAQCCAAGDAELGMCARRKTGCMVPADTAAVGSPPVYPPDLWDAPAVRCDPLRDEVITSWRYTREGCDGEDHKALYPGGSVQIEFTCCSMSTRPWELIGGTGGTDRATETALHGDVAQMLDSYAGEGDVPGEFAVDLDSPGPLIDTMVIQEGASYADAEHVEMGEWDAVMASIEPAAADINSARFCKTDVDGTSDLREAFEPCPPPTDLNPTAGSALPQVEPGRNGSERPSKHLPLLDDQISRLLTL